MNLKLLGIRKIYTEINRKIVALDGINLDINENDYITFVGPSGSGKTTLLSIIGGLIKPTEGDIYFDSEKLTKLPDYHWSILRKKYFGFIFQKKVIIPHLNILENVIAPLVFTQPSIPKKEAINRAEQLLAEFDVIKRKKDYPDNLSGGELQRVTIARALINKPKILLADEPTGDLDIETSKKITNIFKKLNKEEKVTIIMVTHNIELARSAKTIYSIRNGKIEKLLKG